jgi:hypothetical protein
MAALLCLAAVSSSGCDGGIYSHGRVTDFEGRPIEGANILLEHAHGWTFKATTDRDGCFGVGGVTAPGHFDYLLHVEASGHQSAAGKVRTLERNYVTIVLAPLAPDRGPGGPSSTVTKLSTDPCLPGKRPPRPPAAPPP